MSRLLRIRTVCFLIAICCCFLVQPDAILVAQDLPDSKRSVIVFDIKVDRLLKSAESMGADLKQLNASMPMENIVEGVKPSEFKRVHGSLSLPEKVEDLMAMGMGGGLPLEFFVRIEFADADACRMLTENVEDRSNEVELDGKTYWTPEDNDTGVYGHRINDTTFEFGSRAYIGQAEQDFLTAGLKEVWKNAPDEAVRIAVDFESPSEFVAEAVAMGKESADPQTEAYLDLIDNLKSIVVTADSQSENLLTVVANAIDDSEAEEVKDGLDSILMLAQIGGKMIVGQVSKQAPEAGQVVKEVLDSLAAKQDGTVVKIKIAKPAGFDAAMKKLVAGTKEGAASANKMNEFRQLGLSLHNYHDTYKQFPFDVADRKDMNNDLSWRVRVLPFLEETEMYDQMDLAAGPDAQPNAQFAEKMPLPFGNDGKMATAVRIKSEVKTFRDIHDGTSNTVVLIEYPKGEPWLENGGLSIEDAVALVTGLDDGEELIAVWYDGSVRRLTNKIKKETLSNIFNPSDGNIVEDF